MAHTRGKRPTGAGTGAGAAVAMSEVTLARRARRTTMHHSGRRRLVYGQSQRRWARPSSHHFTTAQRHHPRQTAASAGTDLRHGGSADAAQLSPGASAARAGDVTGETEVASCAPSSGRDVKCSFVKLPRVTRRRASRVDSKQNDQLGCRRGYSMTFNVYAKPTLQSHELIS